MTDTVVLFTVWCRKRKMVLQVLDEGSGELVIHAPRYTLDRDRKSWSAGRFHLRAGSGRGYGCACGWRRLILDRQLADRIARGDSEWRLTD